LRGEEGGGEEEEEEDAWMWRDWGGVMRWKWRRRGLGRFRKQQQQQRRKQRWRLLLLLLEEGGREKEEVVVRWRGSAEGRRRRWRAWHWLCWKGGRTCLRGRSHDLTLLRPTLEVVVAVVVEGEEGREGRKGLGLSWMMGFLKMVEERESAGGEGRAGAAVVLPF
jgi:hypothetical protein